MLRAALHRTLNPEGAPFAALAVVGAVVRRDSARRRAMWRQLLRVARRDGIFHDADELYMASLCPTALLDVVLETWRPASVLDVGCGTGGALDYLLTREVDAVGVEGSDVAIQHARHPGRITRADLRRAFDAGRRFDVVWSYEVAEHLHASHAATFVATLARHADRIVLSAAHPGQGGEGHLNEQPPAYWVAQLAAVGFRVEPGVTARLRATPDEFAANVTAFVRA